MTLVYVLHLAICVFMVIVILLQPGKADSGIGFGSSSQSIFGSKGAGNFLTKTTSTCAILFLFTSFYLTWDRIKGDRVVDIDSAKPAAVTSPSPTPTVTPGTSPAATAAPTPTSVPVPNGSNGAGKKK